MEAEVRVLLRDRRVPTDKVASELQLVMAEKVRQGSTVMSSMDGAPL